MANQHAGYRQAGVDTSAEETAMAGLRKWVEGTFAFRPDRGRALLPIGYFANVLDLGNGLGLAISTDGVGSKVLLANLMEKWDTVGIDCMAMNVNDLICVGAEPISMVDCISVQEMRPYMLEQIAKGLAEGARQANVNSPGGEIAQLKDVIAGDGSGFDLVGTAVGLINTDRIIIGQNVQPGDVVVGVASSGIHSNGLTFARMVLFGEAALPLDQPFGPVTRPLGEELLEPTRIYVKPTMEVLANHTVKSLSHITSDGLNNLVRIEAECGFEIDWLPAPSPIFQLIAERGNVAATEMYEVFNMGVGFAVVVPPDQADAVIAIYQKHGMESWKLGHAIADSRKRVWLRPIGLVGESDSFAPIDG